MAGYCQSVLGSLPSTHVSGIVWGLFSFSFDLTKPYKKKLHIDGSLDLSGSPFPVMFQKNGDKLHRLVGNVNGQYPYFGHLEIIFQ